MSKDTIPPGFREGRARPGRPWVSLLLAAFFLAVGLLDLLGPEADLETAAWELTFAFANALFYWAAKGAPRAVHVVALVAFAAGFALAVRDLFV